MECFNNTYENRMSLPSNYGINTEEELASSLGSDEDSNWKN